MKRYQGGSEVKSGIYWSFATGRCVTAGKESIVLPGEGSYFRVPPVFFIVAGPLLGLAFVLFLPFIGFAFIGYHVAVLLGRKIASSAIAVSTHVPGYAYFAKKGRPVKNVNVKRPDGPTPLDELEKEVLERMKR